MTMSKNNPPKAIANLNERSITSDAAVFENFAYHYSKVMCDSKKKKRTYLQRNELRRSPRLAEKKVKENRNISKNKKKRTERSCSIVSEYIPTMKFSVLKQRRRLDLLKSEIKEISFEDNTEIEIIEIKSDSDVEEKDPKIDNIYLTSNINNDPTGNVQIRIEQESPCATPMEASEPMQEVIFDQQNIQGEHMYHYEEQSYTQEVPQPNAVYSQQMPYNDTLPQYQAYEPQSYAAHNTSSPYMSTSVPPPSLTPDSPAYSPYPEGLPNGSPPNDAPYQFAEMDFPYNAHIAVRHLLPVVHSNGLFVRAAEFILYFNGFRLIMQGNLVFTSVQEIMAFEAHFLPNYTYDYTILLGNKHSHEPPPTHEPELSTQTESYPQGNQNYATFDDVSQESNNIYERPDSIQIEEIEAAESPVTEDQPSITEIDEDVTKGMDIDSSDDEEENLMLTEDNRTHDLQPRIKTIEAYKIQMRAYLLSSGQLSIKSYIFNQKFDTINTWGDRLPADTNRHQNCSIRLRTDLISHETMNPTSNDVSLLACKEKIHYQLIKSDEHPGYCVTYENTILRGSDAQRFMFQIPNKLGLKPRIPIEITDIN